jgi:hypothetical protein
MNSKVENSEDFCPNYVQEFGLLSAATVAVSAGAAPSMEYQDQLNDTHCYGISCPHYSVVCILNSPFL